MWKFLIGGLVGLVLGVIGAFTTMGAAVGAGAGAGVAVGLSAGICSMARSAQDLGLMTADQVDEVMAHAATPFGGDIPDGTEMVGSASQCNEALAEIRAAAE